MIMPWLSAEDRTPCMDIPQLFWDDEWVADDTEDLTQAELVRRVCDGCPFLAGCDEWAIRHELYGFWAKRSPKERQDIRRQHGIPLEQPRSTLPLQAIQKERRQQDQASRRAIHYRDQGDMLRARAQAWNADMRQPVLT